MITDGNVKDLMNILDGRINRCISSQLSNVVRIAAAVVTGTNSNGLVSVRLISDPLGGGGAFDVPNKSGENVDIGDNVWIGWFGDLTNSFIMLNNTKAPIDAAADVLWENASPGSSFSAQTISLPSISGYNVFFVIAQWSTKKADYQVTGMAYLPVGSSGDAVIPLVHVNGMLTTASSLYVYTRYVTIQRPGSIVFDAAYRGNPTDAAVGNKYLIPLYIIGATI